jgi:hypothetical protein
MKAGDLVKAHVGNSNREGGYGVRGQGWWHEYVIVIGDFETGEGIKYYGEYDPNHVLCTIDVMMPDGIIVGFAGNRLEAIA